MTLKNVHEETAEEVFAEVIHHQGMVEGKDFYSSNEIAQSLLPELKKLNGAVDVRIQERYIDRVFSDELGIYTDEIVENIVISLAGSISFKPTIWVDPKTGIDYFMGVRMPELDIQSIGQFKKLPISGHQQTRVVNLGQVAKIIETKSEANIPLDRAVIGGQLLSTFLTLFVLPTIFRFVYIKFIDKKGVV